MASVPMPERLDANRATEIIVRGGVIAYPTEGVYGLGCDPFSAASVARVAAIKGRPLGKAMIVIASAFAQVAPLLGPVDAQHFDAAKATWPGPHTWIFPASRDVPRWLTAPDNTIAVRVSAHPIVRALCDGADRPLISTSANRSGNNPMVSAEQIERELGDDIDAIVNGALGGHQGPTAISDARDGSVIRAALPNAS